MEGRGFGWRARQMGGLQEVIEEVDFLVQRDIEVDENIERMNKWMRGELGE